LDVLEHVLKGKTAEALAVMDDLYKKGADPIVVLQDLLDITHLLTKHRALPQNKDANLLPKGEQERLENLADSLSMPTLGRTWQILLKGLGEVNIAPNPQKAAEMVIIRLAYAADLPDPADLVKKLKAGKANVSAGAPANSASTAAQPAPEEMPQIQNEGGVATALQPQSQDDLNNNPVPAITTMAGVVQALENSGEMVFAMHMRMYAHPVKIQDQTIEFRIAEGAPDRLSQDLGQKLKAATGDRWIVTISNQQGEPTLAQLADKADENLRSHIMEQPLVKNIINLFPDAQLKEITEK